MPSASRWVQKGECGVAQARAKHQYMADRIRIAEARRMAEPLLAHAMATLDDVEAGWPDATSHSPIDEGDDPLSR